MTTTAEYLLGIAVFFGAIGLFGLIYCAVSFVEWITDLLGY
jgi:hypothetical protein